MSRRLEGVLDWISPGRVPRPSIPPLEGGLRPNERLDEARVLATAEPFELEDVTHHQGRTVVSRRQDLLTVREDGLLESLAKLPGRCGPVVSLGDRLVVAVDGHGLIAVDDAGAQSVVSSASLVRQGITDLCVDPEGTVLATVCSSTWSLDRWSDALLDGDRTGAVVRVHDGQPEVLVEGLAWPAGVALADGGFIVTESLTTRIERVDGTGWRERLMANLPAYPGRVHASGSGWWVAAPYPRNRLTELLLTEPDVIAEMREEFDPELWMVPRLGSRQIVREPLQHGQRRVLGKIRPWAPAWSYGLAFHIDQRGQVTDSLHSRTDGTTHGVTGVSCSDDATVVLAVAGSGKVVEVEVDHG